MKMSIGVCLVALMSVSCGPGSSQDSQNPAPQPIAGLQSPGHLNSRVTLDTGDVDIVFRLRGLQNVQPQQSVASCYTSTPNVQLGALKVLNGKTVLTWGAMTPYGSSSNQIRVLSTPALKLTQTEGDFRSGNYQQWYFDLENRLGYFQVAKTRANGTLQCLDHFTFGLDVHQFVRPEAGTFYERCVTANGVKPEAGTLDRQILNQLESPWDGSGSDLVRRLGSLTACEKQEWTAFASRGAMRFFITSEKKDLQALSSLYWMTSLEIYNYTYKDSTVVSDLRALSGLQNLETISIGGLKSVNVRGLETLDQLKDLRVIRTALEDPSACWEIRGLKSLSLTQGQLSSIQGISRLEKLTTLDLRDNLLTDADDLRRLPSLSSLELGGNQIKSVRALSAHRSFHSFNFCNNPLVEDERVEFCVK